MQDPVQNGLKIVGYTRRGVCACNFTPPQEKKFLCKFLSENKNACQACDFILDCHKWVAKLSPSKKCLKRKELIC